MLFSEITFLAFVPPAAFPALDLPCSPPSPRPRSLVVVVSVTTAVLAYIRRSHQPYRFVPAENAHHRSVRAPPSTFTVIYNAGAPTNVRNAVDYVLNLVREAVLSCLDDLTLCTVE